MTKVKLIKLQSTHNKLRTNEVIGETERLPELGKRFMLKAPPLDIDKGIRLVITTPVLKIYLNEVPMRFLTRNSTYALEILE